MAANRRHIPPAKSCVRPAIAAISPKQDAPGRCHVPGVLHPRNNASTACQRGQDGRRELETSETSNMPTSMLKSRGIQYQRKPTPIDAAQHPFHLQFTPARAFTPTHANMERSLMQLEDMLSSPSTGQEFDQGTAFPEDSSTICSLMDYEVGRDMQSNDSLTSKVYASFPNTGAIVHQTAKLWRAVTDHHCCIP